MKKAIDVNERTSEQEKQNLKKTCSIARIEAVCFGIALLMALTKNAIGFDKVYSSEICSVISILSIPVSAAAIAIIVGFIISLFNEIENSETPFKHSIADKIKKLSNAVLIGTLALSVPQTAIHMILSFTAEENTSYPLGSVILISGILVSVITMAISYVFSYGCKLQQESDETV